MSEEISQNLTIELKTQGKNTIPIIYPENIITIHGNNGVGKSMAATLLEIASGNYVFENRSRFQKLANIIESCDIQFKNNDTLLYEVNLKPYLWKFDESLNKVNPLTLGKFLNLEKGRKKEIDFHEFRKIIYVRTIRGDESLHQQIFFFRDLFVAKLEQKLKKLENKIEFLEIYQEWLKKDAREDIIDDYSELQEKYNEQLNSMDNIQNSLRNRKETLESLKKKLNLLNSLLYISTNDIVVLNENRKKEEEKVERTNRELDSNYKQQSDNNEKLDELKNQFDEKTNTHLKNLKKLRNRGGLLKTQLNTEFELNLENLDDTKSKKEIEDRIKNNQEEITIYKEKIEKLNKENERIIEINKFLIQIRDICSKASHSDFGDEKLIELKVGKEFNVFLSFKELFEVFRRNNINFKQDKDLKEYQSKVQDYNEKIKKNRKILEILTEYDKIKGKILQLENKLNGKGSKLDNFIDLDSRINTLEQNQKDREINIKNLQKDILEYNKNIEQIEKIIKEVKENPSQTTLINSLNKLGIKFDQTKPLVEYCKQEISRLENEIKNSSNELTIFEQRKKETEKNIEALKDNLDSMSKEIKEAANRFGYTQVGKFIDYFKSHNEKLKIYIKNTENLFTRLYVLKNDILNVLKGVEPKNKAHLKLINNHFDEIFKNIYGQKEFFEYVFKEYSKIKQFDIVNKTIIFETHGGLEETRDLEEFSSGEKTYAYCRSIISMTAGLSKYNIVILDESYALLDHEHSQDLYQFQEQMVQQKNITKFINILPLKEDLLGLTNIVKKNLEEEKKRGDLSNLNVLESQLVILQTFQEEVSTRGYYQEIHFPKSRRKVLNMNLGALHNSSESSTHIELKDEVLKFSFILDGSNIARDNPNSKKASIRDAIRCRKKLQKLGVPEKNILLMFGSGIRHHVPERDRELYETLLSEETVNQAPAERDDDWFIIKYALDHNSYIITNDRYLEYRNKSPQYEQFIKSHSIHYSIIGNDIIFDEGFKEKIKTIMMENKSKK